MEQKEKTSVTRLMRSLHRDIGYLMVGIIVIYSLSGTLLIHRGTNFMKHSVKTERTIAPGLPIEQVVMELRMRDAQGAKTEGDVITFPNGASYNSATGVATTVMSDLIFPFNKLTGLHKSGGNSAGKILTTTGGIMLFFMAISSFWMYRRENKNFKRGIILACIGIFLALALLLSNNMGAPMAPR